MAIDSTNSVKILEKRGESIDDCRTRTYHRVNEIGEIRLKLSRGPYELLDY